MCMRGSGGRWQDHALIRAEPFGIARSELHAQTLAAAQPVILGRRLAVAKRTFFGLAWADVVHLDSLISASILARYVRA
jgi:hypothetical protein